MVIGAAIQVHSEQSQAPRIGSSRDSSAAAVDGQVHGHVLLDSLSAGVYGTDAGGRCTFANRACLRLLGYDELGDLIQRDMHQLIHGPRGGTGGRSAKRCPICQARADGLSTHTDDQLLWRIDGSSFAAEIWCDPVLEGDKAAGSVVMFSDISCRMAAQKALRASERNLAMTLRSIGDAVIATDNHARIARMNPVAERLTGWPEGEGIGRPLADVLRMVNSDTRRPVQSPIDQAYGTAVHPENHTTLISRSGSEYYIAHSAAVIHDAEGERLGVIMVFRDVTAKHNIQTALSRSELRLRLHRQLSDSGVIEWNSQFEIADWNPAAERIFGFTREQAVGRKALGFIVRHADAELIERSWQQLTTDQGDTTVVFVNLTKDGGQRTCEWSNTLLRDDEGGTVGVVSVVVDITAREKKRVQQRRSQKMEALGKLTGGIAHDFNNTLGIVLGYSELLAEALAAEEPTLATYASEVRRAGERGRALTRKLLAFSGQRQTEAASTDINEQIQADRNMLRKTLTARITLDLRLADNLWHVWIDAGDLQDALINLSINAMHAIERQGRLEFSTKNMQLSPTECVALDLSSAECVKLTVSDTGTGMSNAIQERIFDPFFSTKGGQGTGLGLNQVYGFVQRSRGALRVHSEVGAGSQFALYFPRHKPAVTAAVSEDREGTDFERGCGTVLVVDDEVALRDLAGLILSGHGYQVLLADGGEPALALLAENRVDLVVSDVIMPGMDGYQLAQAIRRDYPGVAIQLVSGFSGNRATSPELEPLVSALLCKPFQPQELLRCVRSHMGTRAARPELPMPGNSTR